MSNTQATATAGPVVVVERPAPTAGNVDKIRDIIFGGQMKEYESRFLRLEEMVRAEMNDVRETTRQRLDSLEAVVRRELDELALRDKAERSERLEAFERVAADLKSQGESLLRKIGDSDTRHADAERAIRNDAATQTAQLRDEIQKRTQDLAASLDRRFRELNSSKTDRAALASMLSEVALRLQGDFELPSAG